MLQLISHIGNDGLLQISVPDELKGQKVQILVVLQPISQPTLPSSKWANIAERVHNQTDGGWSEQLKQEIRMFRDNSDFEREKL